MKDRETARQYLNAAKSGENEKAAGILDEYLNVGYNMMPILDRLLPSLMIRTATFRIS